MACVVLDPDGVELEALLRIRSAAGETVLEKHIAIKPRHEPTAQPIVMKDLEPGLYAAELAIRSRHRVLIERTFHFARLAERVRQRFRLAEGFGIVMEDKLCWG